MKESERQISHTKQTQLDQIMNMGSLEECSSNLSSSDSETLSSIKQQVQFCHTSLLLLLKDYFNISFNILFLG